MRGDQLARQWRIIRAIEASPNRLTVTEIARREEIGFRFFLPMEQENLNDTIWSINRTFSDKISDHGGVGGRKSTGMYDTYEEWHT